MGFSVQSVATLPSGPHRWRGALRVNRSTSGSAVQSAPILVGHITRIAQLAAVIARAIPARPHRCPPPDGHLGHKNIQHTVRYTELAPTRFKDFWSD
jgi:type 1 fimbriae regulatory protein FimB/type 1 fimbriae regulatory protein FimE